MIEPVKHVEIALSDVTQFIYHEARLQDEHEYDAWEELWADDGIYWIPSGGGGGDPESEMSLVYDNRSRIGLRIRQLNSGKRHSQSPRSRLCRVISNIEIVGTEKDAIRVVANALVFESNSRGETLWPARYEYLLRRVDGDLRMSLKKVLLVNNDKPLHTLSFLI